MLFNHFIFVNLEGPGRTQLCREHAQYIDKIE